jgi:hypothetical protein
VHGRPEQQSSLELQFCFASMQHVLALQIVPEQHLAPWQFSPSFMQAGVDAPVSRASFARSSAASDPPPSPVSGMPE